MIAIDILGELTERFAAIAAGAKEALLSDLADAARAKWIRLSQTALDATSVDYEKGISEVDTEPGARTITLYGWLPNAIEGGIEAFDLRTTLLLNSKSKIRRPVGEMTRIAGARSGASEQTGWYAHVPFRHMTPGARSGQAMGSAYGARGPMSLRAQPDNGPLGDLAVKKLAKDIYEVAKTLRPRIVKGPGGPSAWGRGKGALRMPSGVGGVGLLRPHHTTDIYAGMVRMRHTYEKATQTQYMTWRTISTRNPEGWQHPGIKARHFAQRVGEHIERILPAMVKKLFSAGAA